MNSQPSFVGSAYIKHYEDTSDIFNFWQEEPDSLLRKYPRLTDSIDVIFNKTASPKLFRSFHDQTERPGYTLLFSNTAYEAVLPQSPYFFSLSLEHPFFSLLNEADEPWGFFALGCGPTSVREKHWQSLLNAVLPDDSLTHFRFYSSSVLRKTAYACTATELQWLLGPYSCFVIPEFSGKERQTGWDVICRPALSPASPQEIAEHYAVRKGPWWQVSEEHLSAFKDTLENVFTYNLIEWLWEQEAVRLLEIQKQCGELEPFIKGVLDKGREWGLQSAAHLSRYTRLYICHTGNKAALHAPGNLAKSDKSREAVLTELEQRVLRSEA